jgi:hypothetical protein
MGTGRSFHGGSVKLAVHAIYRTRHEDVDLYIHSPLLLTYLRTGTTLRYSLTYILAMIIAFTTFTTVTIIFDDHLLQFESIQVSIRSIPLDCATIGTKKRGTVLFLQIKMANLRQTPLTCSGHTRPVVHLAFSDVIECGYFLISACKGELCSKVGFLLKSVVYLGLINSR